MLTSITLLKTEVRLKADTYIASSILNDMNYTLKNYRITKPLGKGTD